MKKFLALTLALLCLCSLFAACKKIDEPVAKPGGAVVDGGKTDNNTDGDQQKEETQIGRASCRERV